MRLLESSRPEVKMFRPLPHSNLCDLPSLDLSLSPFNCKKRGGGCPGKDQHSTQSDHLFFFFCYCCLILILLFVCYMIFFFLLDSLSAHLSPSLPPPSSLCLSISFSLFFFLSLSLPPLSLSLSPSPSLCVCLCLFVSLSLSSPLYLSICVSAWVALFVISGPGPGPCGQVTQCWPGGRVDQERGREQSVEINEKRLEW